MDCINEDQHPDPTSSEKMYQINIRALNERKIVECEGNKLTLTFIYSLNYFDTCFNLF